MPEHPQVPKYVAAKAVTVPVPRGTPALVVTLHLDTLRLILLKNAGRMIILWVILPEMWRWRRALSDNLGVKSRGRPQ